jgi:hypothetical protein
MSGYSVRVFVRGGRPRVVLIAGKYLGHPPLPWDSTVISGAALSLRQREAARPPALRSGALRHVGPPRLVLPPGRRRSALFVLRFDADGENPTVDMDKDVGMHTLKLSSFINQATPGLPRYRQLAHAAVRSSGLHVRSDKSISSGCSLDRFGPIGAV